MLGIAIHLLCGSLLVSALPAKSGLPSVSSDSASDTRVPLQKKQGRESRLAEYRRRYAKTNKKSVESLLELARWAKQNDLPVKEKVVYRKILRIDPNNKDANTGLGRVPFEGGWLAKEEIEKLLAERAEAERLRAIAAEAERKRKMVILPDEVAARSRVTEAIQAGLEASEETRNAFVKSTGADAASYHVVTSDHCQILGKLNEKSLVQLTQIGEYVYRRLNWITYGKEDNQTFKNGAGRHLFYFVTPAIYEESAAFIVKNYATDMPINEARRLAKEPECRDSFYWDAPMLALHIATTKKFMSSFVANGMGHHWLVFSARAARREIDVESGKALQYDRGHLLVWLEEGVGLWASIDAIGENRYWRLGTSTYFRKGRTNKAQTPKRDDLVNRVKAILDHKPLEGKTAKNFFQLSKAQLNQLNRDDLAMAWSVVDYLLLERTDEWRALVKDLAGANSFKHSFIRVFGKDIERRDLKRILQRTRKRRLLDQVYMGVCSRFDMEWRNWAQSHYAEETGVKPPFQPVKN